MLIDACFSGSSANGQLLQGVSGLTARLKAEPKASRASDILFTSAGMNQVASWYPQKGHSLFSYFFFKGIQGAADRNKDGSITVGEMKAYLITFDTTAREMAAKGASADVITTELLKQLPKRTQAEWMVGHNVKARYLKK